MLVICTNVGDSASIDSVNVKSELTFKKVETSNIEAPANNKIEDMIKFDAVTNHLLLQLPSYWYKLLNKTALRDWFWILSK